MTIPIPTSDLARLSRDLQDLHARPAWEYVNRIGAGSPVLPAIWRYQDLRPHLLRASSLITAKQAERRVLRLENPGLPGTGYMTHSFSTGLQMIEPGEIAPAHRHTQNALRFVIEAEGAYTTVAGERVAMHPGDLILTPGWTWHEHGHQGRAAAIWLDVLDTPLASRFGAVFYESFPEDSHPAFQAEDTAAMRYGNNLLPVACRPEGPASPLMVYRYDRIREVLARLACHEPPHPVHGIKMRYSNPIDGGHVFPTTAAFIHWLPTGFSGLAYRSTDASVFSVVEGSGRVHIGDVEFRFEAYDVFVVPPWTLYRLDAEDECVLFSCSDRAAQEALGFWREEDTSCCLS